MKLLVFASLCLVLTAHAASVPAEDEKYAQVEAAARQLVEDVYKVSNREDKVKPGDILESTENNEINGALDDLKEEIAFLDGKACAIGIANIGHLRLVNPQYWLKAGDIVASPPKVIDEGQTGVVLFARKFISLTGSEGVLVYELEDSNYNLALLWSVPLDDLLFNGMKFNFKVYPRSVKASKSLFKTMHSHAGAFGTTGYHSRTEYGIQMEGSMTDNIKSKVTLYVTSYDYDQNIGPSFNTWCETKGVIGKKCRRECSTYGICWTNRKCRRDDECSPDIPCDGKCK